MNRFALALATVGGVGKVPAPGTAGSAVGVLVYFLIADQSVTTQVVVLVLVTAVGTWAADRAAFAMGREDPGPVVIDEVAGQLVTLFLTGVSLPGAALGFLLFRVFDIAKPWPVRRFEALPGGIGIMADDLMAGVYSYAMLRGAMYLAPGVW